MNHTIDGSPRALRTCKGRHAGTLIADPLEGGRQQQMDTVQCVHCGYSWIFVAGSGRIRGWCWRCHGITCARPCCEARGCVTIEQEMALLEAGVPWGQIRQELVPVSVSVPTSIDHIIVPGK